MASRKITFISFVPLPNKHWLSVQSVKFPHVLVLSLTKDMTQKQHTFQIFCLTLCFILPKTMVWWCHVQQASAINRLTWLGFTKSEIGPASILPVIPSARSATWAMVLLLNAHQQWFHSESFQSEWRIFRNTYVSICFECGIWPDGHTIHLTKSNRIPSGPCCRSHADTPDTHVSKPRLATVETSLFNYCRCWRAATILWQV